MADFIFQNYGSVTILTPQTDAGREWIADNLPDDAQGWGREGVVIEPRYAGPILDGIASTGLTIS